MSSETELCFTVIKKELMMESNAEKVGEWVSIEMLIPHPDNPRINDHSVDKVMKSIKRFGFASPIIARSEDKMIIAGHTRYKAAKSLGLDRVPVRFMDLDPVDAKLLMLADNKIGEKSDWDEQKLAELLQDLKDEDLDGIGWDEEELSDILSDLYTEEPEQEYIEPPKPVQSDFIFTLLKGNCLEKLKEIPDNSIDSIVTDPPYEIGFMGKNWDNSGIAFNVDLWKECFRVLKHGGHLVSFSATRTVHPMGVSISEAGFEIRDMISWLYFSGFPKSHDVSKGIDKKLGATPEAQKWEGWGSALKPSYEPAVLARKPLEKGLTIAENVLKYGTGALNIDGCRFGYGDPSWVGPQEIPEPMTVSPKGMYQGLEGKSGNSFDCVPSEIGRWPANTYQCPKASRSEREAGLEHLQTNGGGAYEFAQDGSLDGRSQPEVKNFHPTVKPIGVMRWLCRLITPPNGTVLDPFLGSGTTAVSACLEGFNAVGCEMTEDYFPIIEGRVEWAKRERNNGQEK